MPLVPEGNPIAVSIRPGLPGLTSDEDDTSVTPDTVDEFVRELEARGAHVTVPGTPLSAVSLRGGDLWLPILAFAVDVGANAIGGLVAEAILALLQKRRRPEQSASTVKLRIERLDPGRSVVVEIEAPADDVIQVLRHLD